MCTPQSNWLTVLTTAPCPGRSPTWKILSPSASSTGFASAKVAAGPAAMIVSVAPFAPATPPETGASRKRRPAANTRSDSFSTEPGGQVAIRTTMPPCGNRFQRSVGEQHLLRLRRIHHHQHQHRRHRWPPRGRRKQPRRPLRRAPRSPPARMSKPRTLRPRATRLRAIGNPIAPRPTKPTVVMPTATA